MKAGPKTEAVLMSVVKQGLEAFNRRDVKGLMALNEVDFFGGERVHNIEKLPKTSYNTI